VSTPHNEYNHLRFWLERMGAQLAFSIGNKSVAGRPELGTEFEAWLYGDYSFILAHKLETGGVTLFSRVDPRNSPISDDITHLRVQFRAEDIRREQTKHRISHEHACAMPEAEHFCNMVKGHENDHECKCGVRWGQAEGDTAVQAAPSQKKVERVRGFQV